MKRFLVMTCAASLLLAGRVPLSAEQGKPRAGVQMCLAAAADFEPIPLRPGETWTGRLFTADGQDGGALSFTGEPTEEVTVPAGTFEAVRLRMDGTTHGPSLQSRVWLAPGVGEVKRTVRLSQGTRRSPSPR